MLITLVDNPLVHVKITNHMLCPVLSGEEARTDLSYLSQVTFGEEKPHVCGRRVGQWIHGRTPSRVKFTSPNNSCTNH